MAAQESVLCIDIGASSIKAAEFSFPSGSTPVLEKFAYEDLDAGQDQGVPDVLAQSLFSFLRNNQFQQKNVHIAISGQNAYIPFIKVPALATNKDKIAELITYEAQQKIPSPLDTVAWDYHLIQSDESGALIGSEIDAMLVSVKNEVIASITRPLEKLGKVIKIIEVAPTACFNTAKANGIGVDNCEMILNIGGKSSTLIFIDGQRFYIRALPVAGNSITQQIMAKFKIGLHESENLKHSHAQIRLNDAEDTDDTAGIVARIVKSSMTRLYADVVRTTNLYCSQGGRKPTKLYLAGGSSIIPFVPEFFKEKLNIEAEYLNPFQVISVSPSVDAETLTNLAHMFSETIGLGLRKIGKCPIEIALVPAEIKRQAAFRSKYPYFYATAASLLVYLGLSFWAFNSQRGVIEDRSAEFQKYVDRKSRVVSDVEEAQSKLSGEEKRYNQAVSLLAVRDNWNDLFNQIQQAAPANMWFTSITVSANPAVKEAVDKNSRSANDVGSNPFLGGFLGRMGGQSDAGQEDGNSSSEGSTKMASELTWVNLQGHVVSNVEGTAQVGLEAINLFIDQLIQPKSMFKLAQKSNPRSIFHESSTPDTNITGFELSLELTSPINVASKKRNRDEE